MLINLCVLCSVQYFCCSLSLMSWIWLSRSPLKGMTKAPGSWPSTHSLIFTNLTKKKKQQPRSKEAVSDCLRVQIHRRRVLLGDKSYIFQGKNRVGHEVFRWFINVKKAQHIWKCCKLLGKILFVVLQLNAPVFESSHEKTLKTYLYFSVLAAIQYECQVFYSRLKVLFTSSILCLSNMRVIE